MTNFTERTIDKYILIPIAAMLMTVICLVAGLSEVNFGIFAGDIVLLVTAVLFAQEIKKAVKVKASKELLSHESPIDWLKASTKYFVFSLLSSVVYMFVDVQNIGLENNLLIGYLLIFCVIFFLAGLLYTVRIIWFIIDPASKANILAGKVLITTKSVGIRIILLSFVLFLQAINVLLLVMILGFIFVNHTALAPIAMIYLPTSVMSLIATIPLSYLIVFRVEENLRVRDWIIDFCFFLPWILLISYNLLLRLGL